MSRPSQPSALDMAPPFKRQHRLSASRKSISTPEPATRVPVRWSNGLQQREGPASRPTLSREPTAESDSPSPRQSAFRTNGRRGTVTSDDGQAELKVGAEICAAILKTPQAGDGRRSARALRVCLEEISSSIGSGSPSLANSPFVSATEPNTRRQSRSSQSEVRKPQSIDARQPVVRPGGDAAPRNEKRKDAVGSAESRVLYPCPFRKRNPGRFNIRDHDACARAQFHAIVDIKHHIIKHHQIQRPLHQCPRCGVELETQGQLNEHLLLPKERICELVWGLSSSDPEDGITAETERALTTSRQPVDQWRWGEIWRQIFPADKYIPEPDVHPVVEMVEIEQGLDDSQEALKASIQDKLRLLLPEGIEDGYCAFLAGQLGLVFETHRANIVRQCLTRLTPTAEEERLKLSSSEPPRSRRESSAMRSTRRSRRSTLLQTVRFEGAPDSMVVGDGEIAPSTRDPNPQKSSAFANSPELPPAGIFGTRTPPDRQASQPTPSPTDSSKVSGQNSSLSVVSNDFDDCTASRDSRDSGIGMPCETCRFEACRCTSKGSPGDKLDDKAQAAGASLSTPPPTPPKEASTPKRSPLSDIDNMPFEVHTAVQVQIPPRRQSLLPVRANSHLPLKQQPKLRIKTTDIRSSIGSLSEVGSSGGAFSPQSFKQRVLRTQHAQFMERDMNPWAKSPD
ncbi:hypothetical protein OQA88_2619 [Cercophora sp. LCS_1]